MTKQQFDRVCMELVRIIRERAPRDTGNLADNGVRYVWENEETFTIYIDDGNNGIAPYMKYTNENWDLFRPPLHGKKNPNEAWWQDAVNLCIEHFTNVYKGEIEK